MGLLSSPHQNTDQPRHVWFQGTFSSAGNMQFTPNSLKFGGSGKKGMTKKMAGMTTLRLWGGSLATDTKIMPRRRRTIIGTAFGRRTKTPRWRPSRP